MTILVVDDDETLFRLIASILEAASHQVLTASGGRDALKRIEADCVDILLTDVEMPDVSGPQLVGLVKRRRPGLPVLYMSGSAQPDLCPFLAKPFTSQDLLNGIHRALALHDSMDINFEVPGVHALHADTPAGSPALEAPCARSSEFSARSTSRTFRSTQSNTPS